MYDWRKLNLNIHMVSFDLSYHFVSHGMNNWLTDETKNQFVAMPIADTKKADGILNSDYSWLNFISFELAALVGYVEPASKGNLLFKVNVIEFR